MPRKPSETFTDKELEIMQAVWELGEATVREIQDYLPGEPHYNSVLTIVRVLEKKGHLTHRADGRAHVYRAKEKHARARNRTLNHFIEKMFGGSATSLVLNLVETGDLTKEDIDAIRQQIVNRKTAAEEK